MRTVVAVIGVLAVAIGFSGCSDVPSLSASRTSLGPDSAATLTAEFILENLNHGDLAATVFLHPCSSVGSGRIGPLNAPYKICAISTPEGHFVNFTEEGATPEYGVSFTDRGPQTFDDECYRHLLGRWWEFRSADLSNPQAPCSGGWRFEGGG